MKHSRCLRACRQKCDRNASFVVLAMVLMNSQVFLDVYDVSISNQLPRFGGEKRLHLQGQAVQENGP